MSPSKPTIPTKLCSSFLSSASRQLIELIDTCNMGEQRIFSTYHGDARHALLAILCFWALFGSSLVADARLLGLHDAGKPDPKDAAATARWLAAHNTWGVLSTISNELGGAPFGNVVSYSDGVTGMGRGIPYFYLTALDPTARNAFEDARSSFAICEYPLGTCGRVDPMNPTCAKFTMTGKLKWVDKKSEEAEFAEQALFSKHPEMKSWPADHDFQFFKLVIENLFLIDWFGGAKPLTLEQYLGHSEMTRVSI